MNIIYENILNPGKTILKKLLNNVHKNKFSLQLFETINENFLHFFYATNNGKIIGSVSLNLRPTTEDFETMSVWAGMKLTPEFLGLDIELVVFSVDKKYRGRGIGTTLIKNSLELYENKNIGLFTNSASTPPAFHIYEKFGFKTKLDDKSFKYFLRKGTK
jgi:ribosomal protein S18 acetylase RimI-like enzyme